jgi:hypothetical protein
VTPRGWLVRACEWRLQTVLLASIVALGFVTKAWRQGVKHATI